MLEALIHSKKEWLKNQSNTTKYMIGSKQKKLLSLLDYDVCISFLFNSNKNMALVEGIVGRKREYCKKKIPNTIFLNRSQYSPIRELMDKRSIIENCSQASLPLLLEGFRSEVYIPLFSCNDKNLSMELIGCLYLGSSNYKEFPLNYFLDDKLIKEIINDISKLLSLRFVKWVQLTDAVNMVVFLLGILESKVSHFSTHGYNVAGWCREIGMEVGLSKGELKELTLAALLHDVGKLMVDPKILRKEDELEEDEYHKVQEHVYYSYRILKHLFEHIEGLQNIPNIVKYHHERYDGKGYPYGLKGDEVPFKSYILGIANAVDAMLSPRPHRKNLSIKGVIRELYRNKGTQFHPHLVDIVVERLTKAKRQLDRSRFHSIDLGSLIITQEDEIVIVEGNLLNIEDYYVFKPTNEFVAKKIELSKIKDVELVIRNLNSLNYYQIKLEDLVDCNFYISSIKPIPSSNTFNLLWDLEGILYCPNGTKNTYIEITKIGGDGLSFYLHEDAAKDIVLNKPLRLKVLFEEMDIDITGTIVKSYNFGPYKYFDLHYTNIPDSKRDAIYRQLFKKQIQLRKTMSEYKLV